MSPQDALHLQPYLHLLHQYLSHQITADAFETTFLKLRGDDNYWMEGRFAYPISKLLTPSFGM